MKLTQNFVHYLLIFERVIGQGIFCSTDNLEIWCMQNTIKRTEPRNLILIYFVAHQAERLTQHCTISMFTDLLSSYNLKFVLKIRVLGTDIV